jgi:LDH2 family malate/lactate/ureidoglycolate dehydrogenase
VAAVSDPEHFTLKRVTAPRLTRFCVEVLIKAGLRADDAEVIADVLVTTDTWGMFSHGTGALARYVNATESGGIDPGSVPEVISEGANWALIDGHSSMGMLGSSLAMKIAVQKARDSALAWVGVRNSSHFGAAGYYANMAVAHNMIGIAMSNADPNMVVPGARGHVIGNNPIAYAVPAREEKPVFLDIALSAVAAGKIFAMKAQGRSIPITWLTDADGLPTTEIGDWPNSGSMAPMAGHKGYGIALLVEVLAGVLAGAGILREVKSWVHEATESSRLGHAFIAIDVGAIMPIDAFRRRVDHIIREIREGPRAKGAGRIYLPGEIEWEKRECALRDGIPLPDDVFASLYQVGEKLGVDTRLLD